MEPRAYLEALADELASEFAPIDRIKRFTSNRAIIGAHTEAAVRQFIRRTVAPLRVSTGAIVYEGNTGEGTQLRQIDTMIWSTAMAPAVFECGEFALVPRGNCHAALEIKRSMYNRSGENAARILDDECRLFTDWVKLNGQELTLCDKWDERCERNFLTVFCLQGDADPHARKLVDERKALVLLKQKSDEYVPNRPHVLDLVNLLLRARFLSMQTSVIRSVNTASLIGLADEGRNPK